LLYSAADLQNMLKLKYEVWDAARIDTYGALPLATGYSRTIAHVAEYLEFFNFILGEQ